MKGVYAILLIVASTFAAPKTSDAALIVQNQGISLGGGPVSLTSQAFDAFDTSLGTLNEAIFTTNLSLVYSAITAPLIDPISGPVPAVTAGTINLHIDAINWGFDFQATCFTNSTLPSGTPSVFPVSMNMAWRSNSTSDLVGFTIGNGSVSGPCTFDPVSPVTLSDYVANPVTSAIGLQTDIRSIWTVTSNTGIVSATVAGGGFMSLIYDYTPVPEPTSLLLIVAGIIGIWLSGKATRRGEPYIAG